MLLSYTTKEIQMNVKDAVKLAIGYVMDLFQDEQISNVGLEEVEFDHDDSTWLVTIGFSRPWDYPKNVVTAISGESKPRRSYKVLTILDSSEEVIAVKNRAQDV